MEKKIKEILETSKRELQERVDLVMSMFNLKSRSERTDNSVKLSCKSGIGLYLVEDNSRQYILLGVDNFGFEIQDIESVERFIDNNISENYGKFRVSMIEDIPDNYTLKTSESIENK